MMRTIGEPISVTLYLGGMCGPEGTISHESFHRRRKITLNAHIQEDSLPFYAEDEAHCVELGQMLGELLHKHLKELGS